MLHTLSFADRLREGRWGSLECSYSTPSRALAARMSAVFLPRDMFDNELYFVLWSLVALLGLIVLVTGIYHWPAQANRNVQLTAGAIILSVGVIAASPYTAESMGVLRMLLFGEPGATQTVLTHDQTISGIAFLAGSTVGVVEDGILVSADLKRPHNIGGLVVIGHVVFWGHHMEGGKALVEATLAADQEIPDSGGMWCSPNRPIHMNIDPRSLRGCELARPLIRDGIRIPAGSNFQAGPPWNVELPAGELALIDGISVPAGWNMVLSLDPTVLSSLSVPFQPKPEAQLWVEIRGVRLTGSITILEHESVAQGELWEDTTIEGQVHKKGESVRI
jgi:hypothetical protein